MQSSSVTVDLPCAVPYVLCAGNTQAVTHMCAALWMLCNAHCALHRQPSCVACASASTQRPSHQNMNVAGLVFSGLRARAVQDTINVQELRYGDNDTLSAQVAALVEADWLILLTDVDFLYTANPRTDPTATPIEVRASVHLMHGCCQFFAHEANTLLQTPSSSTGTAVRFAAAVAHFLCYAAFWLHVQAAQSAPPHGAKYNMGRIA